MSLAVVHLVWKPLGLAPFRAFIDSYRRHAAGREHELVVLFNGFEAEDGAFQAVLGGLPHRAIWLEQRVRDLPAYVEAVQQTSFDWYCLLNSYTILLGDGWLEILCRHGMAEGVGAAGATASWESFASHRALMSQHSTAEDTAQAARDYPMFPNAHVRTTGILVSRERWLAYEPFRQISDKEDAHRAESGFDSFSVRLARQGLKLLVVARDGRAWDSSEWNVSGTFRQGQQENLLIADNQTEAYRMASCEQRAKLQEVAWGTWTGMRDHGTWSPMELVRQLDRLRPRAYPEQVLPLYWEDSESDPQLTAALEEAVRTWRALGLPAKRAKGGNIETGAQGTVRWGTASASSVALLRASAPGAVLVSTPGQGRREAWMCFPETPFPRVVRLLTGIRHYAGKPLAFLLADAAFDMRDAELHRTWKEWQNTARVLEAERLLAAYPDRPESTLLMGTAHEREGHHEKAVVWYRRSIELDAGYKEAHLGLARCLLALRRPAEARERIDHVLQVAPLDVRAWKLRWHLLRQG